MVAWTVEETSVSEKVPKLFSFDFNIKIRQRQYRKGKLGLLKTWINPK